jgi:miniconductance mechanosensitive channel
MKNLYIFAPDKNQVIMHFVNDPAIWLKEIFIRAGLSYNLSSILSTAGLVMIVLFLSWLSNVVVKTVILKIVTRFVKRTTSTWDDIFLEQKVFTRLSHFAPALVIWSMAGWALKAFPGWMIAVQKLTYIYMVMVGMVVVNSFIESWHKIYLTLPISKHRTIKGYVQVVKLIVIIIALLVIISVVFRKEVGSIIAGLGALAAVLSLIFKDAILGLVASIQLAGNNMLKVGDWITIPSRGVDGVTEDITLTTVKVRNFDKTILTVPVYSLVSESFQNWRGMEEAGVRQMKRLIFIDMRSIKFPDKELIDKLSTIPSISEHFNKKKEEKEKSINRENESHFLMITDLTNLGLFRIYAESYLKKHPMIENNEALIARHREPEGNGLPLQVYAFCRNSTFIPFENLQSEIIEHLLAIMSEFDLKVFQNPTGEDIKTISGTN